MDINMLKMFSAGSANDGNFKHLWLLGASLFINQINTLISSHTDYIFKIKDIADFSNDSQTLANIFSKNASDKSTRHNYDIMYSYIINKIGVDKKFNLLEIGLGTNNPFLLSTMGLGARPGASLYAFKEYLANANIYGADIDKTILFECERIKTSYVDQMDLSTFSLMAANFGNIKFDLIIDDGLHSLAANLNTIIFALEYLNDGGWIVIEDIEPANIDNWVSIDYILSKKYETFIVKARHSYMYVIQKTIG
jgi:hypothetical protein